MSVKYKIACARTISSLNKKCKLSHFGVYPHKLNHILHHMHEHLQLLKAVFEIRTKPYCSLQSMFGVPFSYLLHSSDLFLADSTLRRYTLKLNTS